MAEFQVTAGGGGLTPEMQARMRERMERMRLIDKIRPVLCRREGGRGD
jgi:hypothetical protein